MFWNEVTLVPCAIRRADHALPASIARRRSLWLDLKDARDPSMNTQTTLAYLRHDKLTGLLRRTYFEELVKRDWGPRESRRLSFLVFDLDCYSQYRDVFGRPGADQSFRRIARVIAGCFRRASDLCGRFDEDQIAALTTGLDLGQASKLAEAVLARVRDLAIHHPRSSVSRYVTASAGVVSLVPPHDANPTRAYESALRAGKTQRAGKVESLRRE
jgi:diguanylate cyclase (GGDEF)-like protein